MKTHKKIAAAFFLTVLLCLLGAAAAYLCLRALSQARDAPESQREYFLKIERGDSAKKIGQELYEQKIIKDKNVFYLFARFPSLAALATKEAADIFTIKSGVCSLSSAMDLAEIYRALSAGHEALATVSIPEGLTISKIASRMEAAGVCSAQDFMKEAAGLEGFLFPDTYSLSPSGGAADAVRLMTENFYKKISAVPALDAMKGDREALLRTLTLASIIEREYRSADEAPLIASVFSNRMREGIGLYSCATVEYVITEILGRPHPDIITYDDLKLQSPYNTYINEGLPPGPICNPGLVALKAAAEPAKSDYYYFQLMDEEAGRHVFTKTLSEHVAQGAIFKTKKASR